MSFLKLLGGFVKLSKMILKLDIISRPVGRGGGGGGGGGGG